MLDTIEFLAGVICVAYRLYCPWVALPLAWIDPRVALLKESCLPVILADFDTFGWLSRF